MDRKLRLFADSDFQKLLLNQIGEDVMAPGSCWFVHLKKDDYEIARKSSVSPYKIHYSN